MDLDTKDVTRFEQGLSGLTSRALFTPSTVNEEDRSVEITWSTGATVYRTDMWDGPYNEALSMEPSAIRMYRLNKGAPFLNSHCADELDCVIGVIERAWVENGEGKAIVRFSSREEVAPIWEDVKSGILRNVSVGYRVYAYEKVAENDGVPTYLATDWEPHEVSLVAIPADSASQVRSEPVIVEPNLEVLVETSDNPAPTGLNLETEMSDTTPVSPTEVQGGENIEQVRKAAIADERARVNEIKAAVRAAKLDDTFADKFIADDVQVDAARAAIINELSRKEEKVTSQVDIQTVTDQRDVMRDGITEALMHRINPASNKLSDNGKRFRGLSLLELARETLDAAGVATRGLSKLELAGRALHGTSDFPLITADVANKTLRQGYDNAARTFQSWARQTTAPDFKDIRRVQLGDAPSLDKVLEHGEFTRGTIAEGQEKYRMYTYGKVVGVTRQLIINDDLSAFTRIPELFGRAAADLESDIVYGLLAANPTMSDGNAVFSSAHANLAGTGAAISIATLDAARKAMRKQKGTAGRFINVTPEFLIVGPDNETTAQQFLSQAYLPQQNSNINPFAGSLFKLVVDPRITNGNWYVAAAPSQIDTIEYAYLEGEGGVAIETRMGFDVDGMEIKVRHDFGAGVIDYRGLYKNPLA
jgi:hypothetical protein